MEQTREKLFLLKCLARPEEESYIFDRDAEYEVRLILSKFCQQIENSEKVALSERLVQLFNEFELGILRAVLTNLHFLYFTTELRNQFRKFFIEILKYSNLQSENYLRIIDELNYFSNSKLDVVSEFIQILINSLELNDNQVKEIFEDSRYNLRFKLIIFKSISGDSSKTKLLISFFNKCAANIPYNEIYINNLISEYAVTDTKGLELAIINYKGRQIIDKNGISFCGAKLLAGFGDKFGNWFLNYTGGTPIISIILPLVMSINQMTDSTLKGRVIKKLIDDWGNKIEPFEEVSKTIRLQLIINENFLNQLPLYTQKSIKSRISISKDDNEIANSILLLKGMNVNRNKSEAVEILKNAPDGALLHSLLVQDIRFRWKIAHFILDLIQTTHFKDGRKKRENLLLKNFRNEVYRPEIFQKLPFSIRNLIIVKGKFIFYMSKYLNPKSGKKESRFENLDIYCHPIIAQKVNEFWNSKAISNETV